MKAGAIRGWWRNSARKMYSRATCYSSLACALGRHGTWSASVNGPFTTGSVNFTIRGGRPEPSGGGGYGHGRSRRLWSKFGVSAGWSPGFSRSTYSGGGFGCIRVCLGAQSGMRGKGTVARLVALYRCGSRLGCGSFGLRNHLASKAEVVLLSLPNSARPLLLPPLAIALMVTSIVTVTATQQPLFAVGLAIGVGVMQRADQYAKLFERSRGRKPSLLTPLSAGYHKFWAGERQGLARLTFAFTGVGSCLILAAFAALVALSALQFLAL